jgi:hypothetical protein
VSVKGKVAKRDYKAERISVPASSIDIWPMQPCLGSGVNAGQADELREFLKKSGVPTDVTNDGDPIYRSKLHREKALKARNLSDKN